MTPQEVSRFKELFVRFLLDKFEDDPFWFKLGEGLMLAFVIWLDE